MFFPSCAWIKEPRHIVTWTPLEWLVKNVILILLAVIIIGGVILLAKCSSGTQKVAQTDTAGSATPAAHDVIPKDNRRNQSEDYYQHRPRINRNGLPDVRDIPN